MLPIFDVLLVLVGSMFLGLLVRLYPQRNPSEEDINNFLTNIGTHDIAHRGGAFNSPENTICAFDAALKRGFKTMEIDIQYTLDKVPVVIHDETLDRTTDGTGLVSDVSLSELKKLKANFTFDEMYHCDIPTLDETIEFAIEHDLYLLFDVKGGKMSHEFIKTLTHINEKYPDFTNRFAVISFFPDILFKVRLHHPRVITGFTRRHDHFQHLLLKEGHTSPLLQNMLYFCDKLYDLVMFYFFVPLLKLNMLEIRKEDVSEWYVRSVAPRPVVVWTVNEPVEKAFFRHLGCMVMTDVLSS